MSNTTGNEWFEREIMDQLKEIKRKLIFVNQHVEAFPLGYAQETQLIRAVAEMMESVAALSKALAEKREQSK